MALFDDVQAFVREANRIARLEDLKTLLVGAVDCFGFDHVALIHHISLKDVGGDPVEVITYPQVWQELHLERGYLSDDPVLTACQTSAAAFVWSEVGSIIALTPRQKEILGSASRCGLGDGFTAPVNVPGEILGSCSFSMRMGRDLPREALPAAQYIGCFAFEAARRIQRATQGPGGRDLSRPRLTPRQFDCLVLAAQGKSDWHIGQLLGIAQDTVHQHMEDAKRRYGVSSRAQLIVRSLFDSQITFSDVY